MTKEDEVLRFLLPDLLGKPKAMIDEDGNLNEPRRGQSLWRKQVSPIGSRKEEIVHRSNYECYPNPDGTRGWVWNPITGSLGDCPNPNARRLANTRLKERYLANTNIAPFTQSNRASKHRLVNPFYDPFYLRFWEDRLYFDMGTGKPKGIFVCDMSDLFGIGIPEEWTRKVLAQVRNRPKHRFYLLTKQPHNLIKWSPFPDHCYVGVSATNAEMFMRACSDLEEVRAKVKYLSIEPFLDWSFNWSPSYLVNSLQRAKIKWVIIGAMTCSGADLAKLSYQYPELTPIPYGNKWTAQPKIEWVSEIVEACDKAGVKVFLKENLMLRNSEGWTPALYVDAREPDGSREYLRQEMPILK